MPHRDRRAGWSLWTYVRHDWRGIVAVTAIVTIAHSAVDPLNTLAFFVLSHFLGGATRDGEQKIVLAAIDQASFEREYRERSPLDRCTLHDHLATIYELRPSLVVIDVDVSPPLPSRYPDERSTRESRCQQALETLLVNGLSTTPKTRAVLMNPFAMDTNEAGQRWKATMEARGLQFGDARLPSQWGVTIRQHCVHDTLASVAYLADRPRSAAWPRGACLSDHASMSFIDPRHYLGSIEVVNVDPFDPRPAVEGERCQSFKCRLTRALDRMPRRPEDQRRVVFFGGAWGESDTYLTPVGELYGVEVHAAAYLSMQDPQKEASHLASTMFDLFIAAVSGFVFAECWRRYFAAATARTRARRERAVIDLGGLVVALGLLGVLCLVGSWWLLAWGLWLSPIPLVVGMAIHAFVESVRGAVADELDDAPVEPRTRVWHRLVDYFWADARALYLSDERGAACLLFGKRLAWLLVVGYALWQILPLRKDALMRWLASVVLVVMLVIPTAAAAQCRGLPATLSKAQLQSPGSLADLHERARAGGQPCGSFLSVISKLMGRDSTGGRRLEKDRPFNPAAAQANVDKALRDPDVRKRIDALRSEVPDETVRLMYEAAVFDEEGYYDARELRIQQLRQRLN